MSTRSTSIAGRPLSGPTGQLVAAHRDDLREVLARHGVKNARLFGSVARGEDHKGSDVDLLVQFAPGTSLFTVLRIQDELETILGVKVDLVPEGGLKERVRERVQPDLTASEPEIPWRQIARMRDHLAHRYFMTELEILEDTIERDLGPLHDAVSRMRALLTSDEIKGVETDL